MNNSMYSCIEAAVGNYINDTRDNRVIPQSITYRMDINDIVINGHPGYFSNLCASEDLYIKITELINNYY